MESIALSKYILLGLAGLFAGFVDAIAGGGGLITLPVLLSVGIPPHLALGTNKLQSSFGSFTAALNYTRKGLVDFQSVIQGIFFTACGAVIGTMTIQHLSTGFLGQFIPIMLLAVFLYFLFSPDLGAVDKEAMMPEMLFYGITGLLLGFYDGFFGPGTGSFWMVAFVLSLGLDLKKATAHTKIMNFTSNIVALFAFILGNNVLFTAGIVMGFCQMIGAFIGSNLVITKGVRFVRVFFLTVVALTIIKLICSKYFMT
ncbi:TSUP family transporter [Thermodesulfobacteriota bacterium]